MAKAPLLVPADAARDTSEQDQVFSDTNEHMKDAMGEALVDSTSNHKQ